MNNNIEKYEILNEKENEEFEQKLWSLFERRSKLYLMDESSSMTKEEAEKIFKSVCYVFEAYLKFYKISKKEALSSNFDDVFDKALKLIEAKIGVCKKLYLQVEKDKPKIESRSMNDSINSIAAAFKMYDYRNFAHIFPDDIDYQLALSVDEVNFIGIDYRLEYLKHLECENSFLSKFDYLKCHQLLGAYCIDYSGLLINLFEPVFANAIALSVLNKDFTLLKNSKEDLNDVFNLVHFTDNNIFEKGTFDICKSLNITDDYQISYLNKVANNIYTQCKLLGSSQEIRSIFTCF